MTLADGKAGQHLRILENPDCRSQEMGFMSGVVVSVFKKNLFLCEHQTYLIALRAYFADQIFVEVIEGYKFGTSV